MTTGHDKARAAGLSLRSNDYREPCPQCSPNRKKKKDPCLHVTVTGSEVRANCFHCDWGMIFADDDRRDDWKPYSARQDRPNPKPKRYW
jgi:hypothetical protein